jgi:hypothetical protein
MENYRESKSERKGHGKKGEEEDIRPRSGMSVNVSGGFEN